VTIAPSAPRSRTQRRTRRRRKDVRPIAAFSRALGGNGGIQWLIRSSGASASPRLREQLSWSGRWAPSGGAEGGGHLRGRRVVLDDQDQEGAGVGVEEGGDPLQFAVERLGAELAEGVAEVHRCDERAGWKSTGRVAAAS